MISIPCLFYKITGLQCPGCGTTRMLRSFLRGDIASAWRYNPAVMIVAPILIFMVIRLAVRKKKTGSGMTKPWEEYLLIAIAVGLVIFGIVRNIVNFI